MRRQSPLELFSRGFQSVTSNSKLAFFWKLPHIRSERSGLSEAGSRTSGEISTSSSISPSGGSKASGNSSIVSEEHSPTLSAAGSYHISRSETIPPELDKNNALGILTTPTTLDQSQRNDSLASPVDAGAAGARDGSGDTRNRKQNKTSSRVESAKQLIRAYDKGHRLIGQDISRRTLYLDEYKQLLDEIKDDTELLTIYNDKLRYDYTVDNRGKNNKREKQLAVPRRELVKMGKVECGVGKCRGKYCKDPHTKEIAQGLHGKGRGTVKSSAEAESDRKDPDLSYKYNYPRSKFPGLVVEVGWSQKSPDLHKKCKWYIEKSRGEIRTVIGVDLSDLYRCYPKSKTKPNEPSDDEEDKATEADIAKMADATAKKKALGKIFVWRANIDNDTGDAIAVPDAPKIFRDENGQAFGEIALCLSLEDFVPERIMGEIGPSHNPEFLVMSADLCYQFDMAVRDQIPWDRDEERRKAEKEREKREQKEEKERKENEEKRSHSLRSSGSPKVLAEWLRSGKKRIHDHIVRK
ncbi:hypothetical protein E0Z10_g10303 [Xylaria hypoxylon]|uniref:Uncharacterized protein n=1 Tax=Xylaria hypoxylon TaxID=37992 RepID=A0A4Z0Y6G7_9PEZI|nr:hypothetical protein E0Z10_g10303 [Xylaria hypoxylon]